jgi:hypothetical protein
MKNEIVKSKPINFAVRMEAGTRNAIDRINAHKGDVLPDENSDLL